MTCRSGPTTTSRPVLPDQGQPTHFQPRRNRFVFKVRVPADWGKKELVWTLTTKGKTEKAFASLREDSLVDNIVQASEQGALGAGVSSPAIRANVAPEITIDTGERRAQIGQPLTLIAVAKDDGVPRPRYGPDSREAERVAAARARATNSTPPAPAPRGTMTFDPAAQRPPSAITVGSQTGLRHSCFVYRGAGRVEFTPRQAKVWEDTRAGANSPWAPRWMAPAVPADGKYQVNVTFADPGQYTIRCMASDGALNTYKDVVVNVKSKLMANGPIGISIYLLAYLLLAYSPEIERRKLTVITNVVTAVGERRIRPHHSLNQLRARVEAERLR